MTSWRWCKRTGVKWILHWLDLKTDKCRFHAALFWSHLNDSYACFWTVNWYVREASEKTQVVPWNYKHYGRCCWHQLNRETVTDTSICPEKYLKHSFFFSSIYIFYTLLLLFFLILLLENDKTFVQHRGRGGVETRTPLVLPSTRRHLFFLCLRHDLGPRTSQSKKLPPDIFHLSVWIFPLKPEAPFRRTMALTTASVHPQHLKAFF